MKLPEPTRIKTRELEGHFVPAAAAAPCWSSSSPLQLLAGPAPRCCCSSSLVLLLELLHVFSQSFGLLHRHRVVQRGAHSSHRPAGGDNPPALTDSSGAPDPGSDRRRQERTVRPVSLQRYHPSLGRSVQELLLQPLVPLPLPHPEGHVHAAPAGLLYGASGGGGDRHFLFQSVLS